MGRAPVWLNYIRDKSTASVIRGAFDSGILLFAFFFCYVRMIKRITGEGKKTPGPQPQTGVANSETARVIEATAAAAVAKSFLRLPALSEHPYRDGPIRESR